ncbi:transposase, partial [Burkholderia aenigmatica]|uniref:transposase n=1 Tax=Burkholderia aenigmatica TaxID=2015348 RepID=UPI001FCFFDB3
WLSQYLWEDLEQVRQAAATGCGLTITSAQIWHWAALPRSSGWPWPLSFYFCRLWKTGALPGREFAAWLGLVPGQTGSGGKIELQGISKRGDTYLRTLLVHGARSIIYHVREPGLWVTQMKQRRPLNVVIVAMANKLARIIWAMLAHQRPYRKDYESVKPA